MFVDTSCVTDYTLQSNSSLSLNNCDYGDDDIIVIKQSHWRHRTVMHRE